ncbi:hypothetical protein ACFXDH_03630 [Streptomyces sp. NPDC059467]|uniref:hypothetical protein n=1 Tax=Streptomyces sp. NPDC059467 TaxID=3346844 RepID=UPI0036AA1E73
MTKKTRIRVARIAAGVVIAAGASLTAAGAASALSIGVEADETGVHANVVLDGTESPSPSNTISEIPTGPASSEPASTPPASEPPTSSAPSESSEPSNEPTQPTDEPTEPTDEPTDGSTSTSGSGSTGGGNNTGTDGNSGTSAQEEGTSALTDTGSSNTKAQGGQLAETGAGQTAFLIIGAATMIAGGVGFRVLPRLMGGGGAAA